MSSALDLAGLVQAAGERERPCFAVGEEVVTGREFARRVGALAGAFAADGLAPASEDSDRAAVLLYPSGSTGLAKGVVQSHRVERLQQRARARLPSYMQPSRIVVLSGLPHDPRGKVDMAALRERITACIGER